MTRFSVYSMATALLAATALSGCGLEGTGQPPTITSPAAWSDPVTPQTGWPDATWWKSFNAPALDVLMGEAAEKNADIGAAKAQVREADALLRISGAALLPTLEGSANASRQGSPKLPGIQTAKQGNLYSPGLTASYEVDFWGKNTALEASAQAGADAARYAHQTISLTVESAVATTYFSALGLQERLTVARENLADAERILTAYRERMAFGASTRLDVAQQENEVAVQRALIPPLEQDLRQSIDALAVLTGRMPETMPADMGGFAQVTVPAVTPGLPSGLLARRPDVQLTEARLQAANANIAAARAAFLPSLDLTAQGGYESVALSSLLQPGSALFMLAAGLTQPIFDGGRLEGSLDYSKARYDELAESYRKTALSAFSDVEDALVAVRKTTEAEDAQRQAEDTARQAYDIAQAQMQGGTVTLFVVLNTQRALFQAKDARVEATLKRLQATVGLFKALGGGWPKAVSKI